MRQLPGNLRVLTQNMTTLGFLWDVSSPNPARSSLLSSYLARYDVIMIQGVTGRKGTHEPFIIRFADQHKCHAFFSLTLVNDEGGGSGRTHGGVVTFISKTFI